MRIARFVCSMLLAVGLLAIPVQSRADVGWAVSVRIGPPVLPVYVQPICPGPGFIWVPGYWAYGEDGYFWVPGTWVEPPEIGFLWTPGYWGWRDSFYVWYPGYWGPEVGYYGGINYGFGYPGVGYYGGYWRGRDFYYNRAVTNVDVTVVRNTYHTTVNNYTNIRVSYNGGPGGTTVRPTSREMAAAQERHVAMTSLQTQHEHAARANRESLASVNHGRPDVAATARPGEFKNRGAAESRRAVIENRPPETMRETDRRGNSPSLRPPSAAVNPERDRKQQREMEKMRQRQDADRQRAERQQIQEQQRLDRQRADQSRQEQRHQREIEQMRQRQDAERQKVETRHNDERQRLERQRADQARQEQLQGRHQQQLQQMQQRHDQQVQKLQERQQREVQQQQQKNKDRQEPR